MSNYIEKIYSKIHPELLIHQVIRFSVFQQNKRIDVSPLDKYLQMAAFTVKENQTFKPHRHVFKSFNSDKFIANESWVVVYGVIKAQYYDIEGNNIIDEKVLASGDVTMTFENGGHNYIGIAENNLIYEFKSGPYKNQEWDKVFI